MNKINWKKLLPYAIAIITFVTVAMFYCAPALDGKVLVQGDINSWKGAAQEAITFYEEEGYSPWWTNSMFSGMPTYQITGKLKTSNLYGKIETIARGGFNGDFAIIGVIFA